MASLNNTNIRILEGSHSNLGSYTGDKGEILFATYTTSEDANNTSTKSAKRARLYYINSDKTKVPVATEGEYALKAGEAYKVPWGGITDKPEILSTLELSTDSEKGSILTATYIDGDTEDLQYLAPVVNGKIPWQHIDYSSYANNTITWSKATAFSQNVSITKTTTSTSKTTGALVVSGGVGIGGALNVGGDATITGTLTATNIKLSGENKNIKDIFINSITLSGYDLSASTASGTSILNKKTIDTYVTGVTIPQASNTATTGPVLTIQRTKHNSDNGTGTAALSNLTVNLPVASASAAGVVVTGAQTFAGNKTFSGQIISTYVPGNSTTYSDGSILVKSSGSNKVSLGVEGPVNAVSYNVSDAVDMTYDSTDKSIVFTFR